ncbi:DUF4190 domain-containing protein [Streptomyces sp. NRRL S-118]|uniref:DUF4190 domain-containing protein n=1 Tax=Streptomyces sp. NRRL S-118 TaxID=1463881 RepID=UPI0004CB59D7|nr:DUF4190 domain-containing protein [Streptomyces sp. NRRL S-118]
MPDNSEPNDPWAPPESRSPQDAAVPNRPPVHDQPTVTSMPAAGEVPPPPIAPGGPAQPAPGPYGYPAPGVPAAPPPATNGYGYPGYPGYSAYGHAGWQAGPANGMGITSMVLGIIATAGFCMYGLGIILGILALIFGIVGRKRVQRGEANNGGMATAGIILGAIGTVVSAAFLAFVVWAIVQSENNRDSSEDDSDPFATSLVITRD